MYNRVFLLFLCTIFFIGSTAVATEENDEVTDNLSNHTSCYLSCHTYNYYIKRDSGAWAINDFLFSYATNQLEGTYYPEIAEKILKAVHKPNAELSLVSLIPMIVHLPQISSLANQLHIPHHELFVTFDALTYLSSLDKEENFDIFLTSLHKVRTIDAMLILLRAVAHQQEFNPALLMPLNGNSLAILLGILNNISRLDIQQAQRVIYTLFDNIDYLNHEDIWSMVQRILPIIPDLLDTMNMFVNNERRNALYQDILHLLETFHLTHLEDWNTVLQEKFLEEINSTHLDAFKEKYQDIVDAILSLRDQNSYDIDTILKNTEHSLDRSRVKSVLLSSYIVSAILLDSYLVPDTQTRYDRYMNTFYNMREIALELLEIHDIIKDYMPDIHQWWMEN